MKQRLAIANDHAGVALKQALIPVATALGFEVLDLGTNDGSSVDYPDYGRALGEALQQQRAKFGLAICGSGIGISIAANRLAGVRAALCQTDAMATLARRHNDANILALGARLVSVEDAKHILTTFLTTAFEGGRHASRVEKLG